MSAEFLTTMEDDDFEPSDEAMRDHWNGKGHIEFFVVQNVPGNFEVEVMDYSGCAGGLEETLGCEYALTEMWYVNEEMRLFEGVTYTVQGVNVHWSRGDGWTTDDDVDYYHEGIIQHPPKLLPYLRYKAEMIWHRQVACRFRATKDRLFPPPNRKKRWPNNRDRGIY